MSPALRDFLNRPAASPRPSAFFIHPSAFAPVWLCTGARYSGAGLSTLRSTVTEDGSTRQRSRRVCWPARRLQPRHYPRAWEGGVAIKVNERGSERGGSTIAWFTSFAGETVQALVEP